MAGCSETIIRLHTHKYELIRIFRRIFVHRASYKIMVNANRKERTQKNLQFHQCIHRSAKQTNVNSHLLYISKWVFDQLQTAFTFGIFFHTTVSHLSWDRNTFKKVVHSQIWRGNRMLCSADPTFNIESHDYRPNFRQRTVHLFYFS